MADIKYSYAKLGEAVSKLAVHPGRVKERLTEAANILTAVDPEIFVEKGMVHGVDDYWQTIWSSITTAPRDPQRGVFALSIDRLSEAEASHIAQLIVSVEAMVATALEDH